MDDERRPFERIAVFGGVGIKHERKLHPVVAAVTESDERGCLQRAGPLLPGVTSRIEESGARLIGLFASRPQTSDFDVMKTSHGARSPVSASEALASPCQTTAS